MTDYIGVECPVCGKPFDAQDDIVVCPECGAPYHRACYHEVGQCVFADRHGTPDAWKPPAPKKKESAYTDAERTRLCPRCGGRNFPDSLFCDKCGFPLSQNSVPPTGYPNPYGGSQNMPNGFPGQGGIPPVNGMPFTFDPMGGVNPDETIDTVSAGDIAKYVKQNTPYYMSVFKKIKDTKSGKFNFCAFLFTGGWMLYRKQYKYGILLTVIMAALMIGYNCIQLLYTEDIVNLMLSQAGIDVSQGLMLSYSDGLKMAEQFFALSTSQQILFFTPTVLNIAKWVIMIILGFKGNKLYMKHCVSAVSKIKAASSAESDYNEALQTEGGVNIPLATCLFVCYIIISWLPVLL